MQRLVARLELRLLDVVDQIDLRADALGLGLRVILVDADNDTRLLLHIVDHEVQVVADQQEAVDDDQTGNRDADRRKGHEPVLEHGAGALAQQETEITALLHSYSTHPFRR